MDKSVTQGAMVHLPEVFSDQLCCDLLIKNNEKSFLAHKLVVCSSCSFLRLLLSSMEETSQDIPVIIMPGVSSKEIESFLSISYGLLQKNMKFYLREMTSDFLFSDIRKYFLLEREAKESLIVEKYGSESQVDIPLLNIDIPEEEFLMKMREGDMGDLANIILDHTSMEELRADMKIKTTKRQIKANKERSITNASSPSTVVCSICGKCFKKTYLSTHIREIHYHKQFSKYFCEDCHIYFTRKEKYEGHLSKTHGAPKRYQCTICGKQFALNSDLFKHRAQVHITKPTLPCKHCGKLFKTGERLRRHELLHLAVRPWDCPTCGKKYPRKDKLKSHIKVKHSNLDQCMINAPLIR